MLLASLGKTTKGRYLNPVFAYFTWCKLEQCCESVFSLSTVLEYLADLYDGGAAIGQCHNFIYGLEIVSAFYREPYAWTEDPFIKRVKSRWSRESGQRKVARYFLSRSEIHKIIKAEPPKGQNVEAWRTFWAVSWAFLLRRSEVLGLKPKDIYRNKCFGVHQEDVFAVYVRDPKTAKGSYQNVYFPRECVPSFLLPYLDKVAQETRHSWTSQVNQQLVIPWLRSVIVTKNPESLVHHSCRHGRACDLLHNCGYAIGATSKKSKDIMTLGRWRSRGAALVYLHSKINE